MGDYFQANIEIGGEITDEGIENLVDALCRNGPFVEHDDDVESGGNDEDSYREEIKRAIAENRSMKFSDPEASYGQFPETESCCQLFDLTYVRHSDAKYEYDATIDWWKPGMDTSKSIPSNTAGDVLIRISEIERLIRHIKSPAEAVVSSISKLLDERQPPKIPPLTKKTS
jgi:hypothetical protein